MQDWIEKATLEVEIGADPVKEPIFLEPACKKELHITYQLQAGIAPRLPTIVLDSIVKATQKHLQNNCPRGEPQLLGTRQTLKKERDMKKRRLVLAICLLPIIMICTAVSASADCVRSCEAHLYMRLTYALEGGSDVERKTQLLKTTRIVRHDGRVNGRCVPHLILEAKKKACVSAVSTLVRQFSSPPRQKDAVCEVVDGREEVSQNGSGLRVISVGGQPNEMFPGAAWFRIDEMYAYGKRDAASAHGQIERIDRGRFRCNGVKAVSLSPAVTPGAPPPPPSMLPQAGAGERLPDLYVTKLVLSPAVPVKGQPVSVRLTVSNKGRAAAGAFTVQWFPGENYPQAACSWRIERLPAQSEHTTECRYPGYPSAYNSINTKALVNVGGEVTESDEQNNVRIQAVRVQNP